MKINNPFSLENKTILVTGSSSGIGRTVAIQCSQFGASVIITGRNQNRLIETYDLLNKDFSQEHFYCSADLTVDDQISQLVLGISELDGIVLCSGINDKSPIKHIDRKKIEKMYNTNVYGPILLINELVKQKKIKRGASIVFISSISSIYATVSNALYASSKGAVNSLVRVLALELAPKKIRVNSIMPGMVKTSMINAYGLSEEDMVALVRGYPMGRIGEVEDIANAVLYFLSDASAWTTGANLVIDGGVTLR